MPTVLRSGPYRVFFYSSDGDEPPHVHVVRDKAEAKFWLDPLRLEYTVAFRTSELRRIRRILVQERQQLLDAWYEFFGRTS